MCSLGGAPGGKRSRKQGLLSKQSAEGTLRSKWGPANEEGPPSCSHLMRASGIPASPNGSDQRARPVTPTLWGPSCCRSGLRLGQAGHWGREAAFPTWGPDVNVAMETQLPLQEAAAAAPPSPPTRLGRLSKAEASRESGLRSTGFSSAGSTVLQGVRVTRHPAGPRPQIWLLSCNGF